MARTVPISAEQPLDASRTAAEQVVTLAAAEVAAVQAVVSVTLAALLWPLIPAAHAVAGLASALSLWRPLPEQAAAARQRHAGPGADPVTGQPADAAVLRARLLEHVYPAPGDHGDTQISTGLLRRLDDRGTGADRQRTLFTSAASTPAFIAALACATRSSER